MFFFVCVMSPCTPMCLYILTVVMPGIIHVDVIPRECEYYGITFDLTWTQHIVEHGVLQQDWLCRFQWRAGQTYAHAIHSNTHTDGMIDIPTLQEILRKFLHVASKPVVGAVVGYFFLGLTPLPCVFKVKVVSGCNERTGKHCFHVFYTHIIYLCWFHQGCIRLLLCS